MLSRRGYITPRTAGCCICTTGRQIRDASSGYESPQADAAVFGQLASMSPSLKSPTGDRSPLYAVSGPGSCRGCAQLPAFAEIRHILVCLPAVEHLQAGPPSIGASSNMTPAKARLPIVRQHASWRKQLGKKCGSGRKLRSDRYQAAGSPRFNHAPPQSGACALSELSAA